MTDQPNLRCKNCWRPYAMHVLHTGGPSTILFCPTKDYNPQYEPDTDSPEARVYAAVEELIAAAQSGKDFNYTALGRALNDLRSARAERTK